MANELAYAVITPYSLLKSRTGGIIGRLLALSGTELVGARLYMPSDKFVDEYITVLEGQDIEQPLKKALLSYLNDYFRKDNKLGISNRILLLLLEGEDAIESVKRAVGSLSDPLASANTVRGTYGDLISYSSGEVKHFEPAVFVGTDKRFIGEELRLFARYAQSDGGVLENRIKAKPGEPPETTLVILKPDNFKPGSSRPGNIIDMFSRTGLTIVASKMLRLSIAEAEEFYGPLQAIFRAKLKKGVAGRVGEMLAKNFDFPITEGMVDSTADLLKDANARHEFYRIVQYMTGRDPYTVTPEERTAPGTERCLALLYRGPNAVQKIRESLGSTNPQEAAPGTVRSVYGNDLMRNGAHASDSIESAERERKIIGMWTNDAPSEVEFLIQKQVSK